MQDAAIKATERHYYELFHLWERSFNDSILFPCYSFASFIMLIIASPQDNRFAHIHTRANREVLTWKSTLKKQPLSLSHIVPMRKVIYDLAENLFLKSY